MKSSGLVRKAAAFGASTAVLATMVVGLMAGSAQAATAPTAVAGKATTAAVVAKPRPSVSVSTPRASVRDYQGECPVKVNFSAKIKVKLKGKTEVAYRWLNGDGSKSKVRVIKLKGHGVKYIKVSQSITFKGNVKGWEAVQVLGPRKATSKKGYFSVSCHEDKPVEHEAPKAWARAWASPDSYVGPCTPGDKIDFTGVIKVNSPRWVHYRWILNGKVVDGGEVKVWDTRKVGFGLSPRESHKGWAVLEILGRNGYDSNRVHYSVWCKDEPPAPVTKVTVSDLVTAADHANCPTGKVSAVAKVTSTGAGRVQWTFQLNGDSVAKGVVDFDKAGVKYIDMPAQTLTGDAATKGGKVTVHVTGPNNADSISQEYSATCKPAGPGEVGPGSPFSAVATATTCPSKTGSLAVSVPLVLDKPGVVSGSAKLTVKVPGQAAVSASESYSNSDLQISNTFSLSDVSQGGSVILDVYDANGKLVFQDSTAFEAAVCKAP